MTVTELLKRSTSAELSEQMAFDIMRHRQAEEAERQRALGAVVENGLRNIKQELKR